MLMLGNTAYICERCGAEFRGWASAARRYCSVECAVARRGADVSTHGESQGRLHSIWSQMKTRCSCSTAKSYPYYGGRGIRVCQEWIASYEAFRDWALANGYHDDLELDRRDTNGNYEPGNCRWATRHQQMANTRKPRTGQSSRFKGVSWNPIGKNWKAQIKREGRNRYIGVFGHEVTAALAYDDAAFELRG